MLVPVRPKIYHIVHIDRLPSIISDGRLWSDAEMAQRGGPGTTIGINNIKQQRLGLTLSSHPDLHVGDCVPFYFCPRSVMLYVIRMVNHSELAYRGGQDPIVHLEADLRRVVGWANAHSRRWAFTSSNAASSYFEDYSDLVHLDKLDWDAIQATDWRTKRGNKQAEFLIENSLPWKLISRVGVWSHQVRIRALNAMQISPHRPLVEIKRDWYY